MFHFKNEKLPVEATGKLLRKVFSAESPDQKFLYKTDIKCIWLYLFGYKISKYELQEYFEKLGKDYYKEGLDYLEFEKKALSEINRLDNVEELRNAFITVDFSCKGFLTIEDLTKQFKLIAPHLSNKMVFDVFREMDTDQDGRISYKDFEFAMEYINDDNSTRSSLEFFDSM